MWFRFGIVTFADRPSTWRRQLSKVIDKSEKNAAMTFVNGLEAKGGR